MNKYQKRLHKEIKNYMEYYYIDREEYAKVKFILKNFTNYTSEKPCSNCCNNLKCSKVKNKILWCEDNL